MKAIISHDIDHITVWEHYKDLIIPKHIGRSLIELFSGYISLHEFYFRFGEIVRNKWNYIDELLQFDSSQEVPATFFIGVNKGLGLAYSQALAGKWCKEIMKRGFDVGAHGIEYKNDLLISKEHEEFGKISGLTRFGIRMHYLRSSTDTLESLSKVGYLFDSTCVSDGSPYKVKNLWEFPLHIMDGMVIYQPYRWLSSDIQQIKDRTKKRIDELLQLNLSYLTILFHDRYFSNAFKTWMDWYIWLIMYLKNLKIEFISYTHAISELESD